MSNTTQQTGKVLFKLSKSEYQNGAHLAFHNAKNHFEVAKKAAEINRFGIATSLLITAAEELAKASVLKIKAINGSIEIDNLDQYFSSHKVKHESIIRILFASFEYINIDLNMQKNEEEQNEKKDDNNIWITELVITIIVAIISHFIKDNVTITETTDSVDTFENTRMAGFYLGFDKEKSKWKIPDELFDEKRFIEFKSMIGVAFDTIEHSLFGDKINSENIVEFADKLEDKKIITEHLKEKKVK